MFCVLLGHVKQTSNQSSHSSLCLVVLTVPFESVTIGESRERFLFLAAGVCKRSVLGETNVLKCHCRLTTTASLICSGKL